MKQLKNFINKVLLPYFVYLMYFLGVGFLGGAIVHFPVNPGLYGMIGVVGAIIFTVASTVNEWVTNKRHILQEGVVKIILYSLVLSVGLGMISGGIQHFIDFPIYASYLIPGGFIISLIGYVLSKEIKLDNHSKVLLIGYLILIALPLFLALNTWAQTIVTSSSSHGHSGTNEPIANNGSKAHSTKITNDEVFINQMIPHHEEAINTSTAIVGKTENAQLKDFALGVIAAQSREVSAMKGWYKRWYGKDYISNSDYKPMMGDLSTSNVEEFEKKFITGMILHHKGAIDMARQILAITEKSEINVLAKAIITEQSEEIIRLQNLLEGYNHEEVEH